MSYCNENTSSFFGSTYYCDWNDQVYTSYRSCYTSCLTYDYNQDGVPEPIPISKADFTLLLAFAGAIAGLLISYAIIGASN